MAQFSLKGGPYGITHYFTKTIDDIEKNKDYEKNANDYYDCLCICSVQE